MASFDHQANLVALRGHLLATAGIVSDNVAYENRAFNPGPAVQLWTREQYVPNDERLVATRMVQALGFYVPVVYVKRDTGSDAAATVVQAIMDRFIPSTLVVNGGHSVRIIRAERLRGGSDRGEDSPWFGIPVRISWRAYATID